jgi:hypothetical protein
MQQVEKEDIMEEETDTMLILNSILLNLEIMFGIYHEMLSMLPLDGSKGRVGGMLICQFFAEFRIATKHDKEIELALVAEFDFESPDICCNFHAFVWYLISFNNHCK